MHAATPTPTGIQPEREFRAAWVATVANIDWPSRRDLSTEEQIAEMNALLDLAATLNLNAIIFQVRPMADALYPTPLAPWSEFLTGAMGRAPDPFYDPLALMIEGAHQRGLELHAWFNPYRASHPDARSEVAPNHISRTNPAITRQFGRYRWLDPTDEATKRHTLEAVIDIVRRYDVDGIHYDDYFYPYPSYANGADFPDHANWNAYRQGGGSLSRDDWRRSHVNNFVQRLYAAVKKENPRIKVGVSPFGIWRPNFPEGIEGLDQYGILYADAKLWLNRGWIDYFAPQLYWPIDQKPQAYTRLLDWWIGENHQRRHIWPGNFTSRITLAPSSWAPTEIVNQIAATRARPGAGGNIHFSMVALMQNRKGIADILRRGPYAKPALVPPSPWIDSTPPTRPTARLRTVEGGDLVITWSSPPAEDLRVWAVYTRVGREWKMKLVPAHRIHRAGLRFAAAENITEVAVSAIDRLGNESDRSLLRVR
jgi:uncharacterized lipoprotein YddW (UPF0748 family)